MSIADRVQDTLAEFDSTDQGSEELRRLSAFFDQMKSEGIAKTRVYDIPHVDTIGRGLYLANAAAKRSDRDE